MAEPFPPSSSAWYLPWLSSREWSSAKNIGWLSLVHTHTSKTLSRFSRPMSLVNRFDFLWLSVQIQCSLIQCQGCKVELRFDVRTVLECSTYSMVLITREMSFPSSLRPNHDVALPKKHHAHEIRRTHYYLHQQTLVRVALTKFLDPSLSK